MSGRSSWVAHPHALSVAAADAEVRDTARALLAGTGAPDAPLDAREVMRNWPALDAWARGHGLDGLLAAAVDGYEISDDIRAAVQECARDRATAGLMLEGALLQLAGVFDGLGVEWRLLKGAATARLVYPEPGQRPAGDVDVLVWPADFERVVRAMRAVAADENLPPYGPAEARHRKARSFTLPGGAEVDLHQRVQGPTHITALPTEFVFDRPQPVKVHGRSLQAMSAEAMLLHAALHLSCQGTRLNTVADVIRLAHRPDLDLEWAARAVTTTATRVMVGWALQVADEWVRLPEATWTLVGGAAPTPRELRIAGFVARHPPVGRAVDRFTGPEWPRRLGESLWPSPAALADNGLTRSGHLRRVASEATGVVTRRPK